VPGAADLNIQGGIQIERPPLRGVADLIVHQPSNRCAVQGAEFIIDAGTEPTV